MGRTWAGPRALGAPVGRWGALLLSGLLGGETRAKSSDKETPDGWGRRGGVPGWRLKPLASVEAPTCRLRGRSVTAGRGPSLWSLRLACGSRSATSLSEEDGH